MSDITKSKVIKPTIIANYGSSNRGKSDTVRKIYHKIKSKYPHLVELRPEKNTGDISALFIISGTIIGIESQGDPQSRLFESLDEFEHAKCDIIICACRTRGCTTDRVLEFETGLGYRLIWAQNMQTSTTAIHHSLNKYYVSTMLDIFDDILNGII